MIQARYRKDYDGEFVILESRFKNGKKEQTREWIPNPIENHHISERAAVIGSDIDLELFDYKQLQKHRGGLLGKKRLQTYASGDLWQNMKYDFVVTTNKLQLESIKEKKYNEENIVYTSARNCISHPESFYLTPYSPHLNQLALSVYLAAFDGHSEIFLLGYNNETPADSAEWQADINAVFSAYRLAEFILVGVESNMPTTWRNNRNVRCMEYREFVSYCDV
jgi:hypothetical protein